LIANNSVNIGNFYTTVASITLATLEEQRQKFMPRGYDWEDLLDSSSVCKERTDIQSTVRLLWEVFVS
jgi:hypothetical protein